MKRPVEDEFNRADSRIAGEWREIPGFGGAYEINDHGDIRSWLRRGRGSGKHMRSFPYILTPFMSSGRLSVKLQMPDGKEKSASVLRLMVDVWLGGCPKGNLPYHINGDLTDYRINNIGFSTRRELGSCSVGRHGHSVEKVNRDGKIIAVYPSARAAAKANFISYQSIINRCRGQIKDPFRFDGYSYCYKDN